MPRGLRNNNPLNIKISNSNWIGKVSPNTDGVFEQFDTIEHGYRAAGIILSRYINVYGCNTIEKIIRRWCPDSSASSYIDFVCKDMTSYYESITQELICSPVLPTGEIDISFKSLLAVLIYSMARFENGKHPSIKIDEIKNSFQLFELF